MKILVISFYFPPYNSIASVRVGKIAKYLEKFGHEIKVISAQKGPLLCNLDIEIPIKNVTYTQWRKLAPDNLKTNFREMVAGSNRLYHFTRQCWRVLKSAIYFPDEFIGWTPYAIKAAKEIVNIWKPDIIFVSVSPYSSLFVASRISAEFKIPWIADFRDLWTDNPCYPFGGLRKMIERKIEKKVLSQAAGLCTVSEPLAQKLRLKFKGPVEIICNGFDPKDYDLFVGSTHGSKEVKLNIVYIGTIYDDYQDPSPLFSALKRFDKSDIKVSFYGTLSPRLRSLVKKMGVEERVEFKDPVPYIQSLNIQKNADILLFLLWINTEEKGMYTGKLFEYLGSGRPILGVGPDSDVAADLIKERNLGIILNSSDDIYWQLKRWLEEKEQKGSIPSLPVQSRHGFSREEQAKRLEKFMLKISSSL